MSNTPVPEKGFKFGSAQEEGSPNSVSNVAKLDAYLVAYKDGQGKDQARICFRIPNSDKTFILQERINGQNVATPSHAWFHKILVETLKARGLEGGSTEGAESV